MAAAQAASCRPLTRALPNPLAAILHCRPCATPRTVASHSEITPRETLVRAETANQALHKRPGHSLNVSAQLRTESRSQSNRIQQNSPELSVPRGTSSLHSSSWPHPHKNIQVGLQQGRGRQASNDIPFTRTAAARCRQQASPNVQADNMSRRHPSSFHKSASFCSRNVAIHLVPRPLSSSAMTSVHWHQRLKCFIHGSTVLQLETRPNRQRIHRWKPAEMGGSRVSRLPLCSSAEAGSSDPPTRHKTLDPPLPLVAPVVRGFGRGSRQMGFPTGKAQLIDFVQPASVALGIHPWEREFHAVHDIHGGQIWHVFIHFMSLVCSLLCVSMSLSFWQPIWTRAHSGRCFHAWRGVCTSGTPSCQGRGRTCTAWCATSDCVPRLRMGKASAS